LSFGACGSRVISYVAVDSSAAAPIDVQIEPRHIASARGVRDRSERGPPHCDFGPIQKEQQATALLHRGREQLVRQRTMLVNALRAHLAEFGIVAARGLRNVSQLIAIVRDDADIRLPAVAQQVLQVLANQIEQIETAVAALERQLLT